MGSSVPFVDLRRQYMQIRSEIDEAIQKILDESAFVGGWPVAEFEAAFADYCGVRHAIGVGNGTDALEIMLEVIPPRKGEVIVPVNSFVATSEAVTRAGHTVVFADVGEDDYCIDPADVGRVLTGRTVAVLPVHLYGQPARMRELAEICRKAGITLLEDAAQAVGAEYHGRRAGGLAEAAGFSFYPGKNLGAYGDAGVITCDVDGTATEMRMLSNHGRTGKYDHRIEGRNSRLDGIQAAILNVKLRHLEEWTRHRRTLADEYRRGLVDIGDLVLPEELPDRRHVYHLFVIRTKERDALRNFLHEHGVATGIHYPTPLPRLEAYRNHPQHRKDFSAVSFADQVLSLPMADSITIDEVGRVSDLVRQFFSE